jgi:hypothetical protein
MRRSLARFALLVAVALPAAAVAAGLTLSGSFRVDPSTAPDYSLNEGVGLRTTDVEVMFEEHFPAPPVVKVELTAVESAAPGEKRCSIAVQNVWAGGFVARAKVWGDAAVDAVEFDWEARQK